MKRILLVGLLAAAAVSLFASTALAKGAGGVTGEAFYVDGEKYRTVNTPTDLSETGAPDESFDTIYQFFGVQDLNVATAAPGDTDYNGGRWQVHGLEFANYNAALAAYDANNSGDFDSDAEVDAALQGGIGGATDIGIVKWFVCPVIPLPGGHS